MLCHQRTGFVLWPRTPRRALAYLAWLCALSCAVGAPGCGSDSSGSGGEAEIGTGTVAIEPLSDGDRLDLIAGQQGGFHFVVHARMRGLSPGEPRQPGHPSNPTTYLRVLDEDGERVDLPEVRSLGYVAEAPPGDASPPSSPPADDLWYALPSARIVLIDNDRVADLYDRPVTLEIFIEDVEGRTATASVEVIAIERPLESAR